MQPDYVIERDGVRLAELYCADCMDVLPMLAAGNMDAIITDPPYGMKKADWDRPLVYWLPRWLNLVKEIPMACFCGIVGARYYPTPHWMGAWARPGSVQRMGRYHGFNNWEPILFYNIRHLANDLFTFPYREGVIEHRFQKPLSLMKRLVEVMTEPGQCVLDCFMGSGTTGVACVQTGRSFVGVEIDDHYFEIARRRIETAYAQVCLPLEEPQPVDKQGRMW